MQKPSQNTLFQEWQKRNRELRLFDKGQTILLAVSGGIDSMVLWHLFERLCASWQLRLVIAHLNHQLRGRDAELDEALVQKRAAEKNAEFVCERKDVRQYCRDHRNSLEAGARRLRYDFLQRSADSHGCQRIATGHNADDQAESVLLNLMRGTGIAGLGGIARRQGRLIRPLLDFSREQIADYARFYRVAYRFDKSNIDLRFTRNRVRHTLLPLLKSNFNPSMVSALNRMSENMRQAEIYLQHQTEKALRHCLHHRDDDKIILDIEPFLMYFTFLQKYILDMALHQLAAENEVGLDFKTFYKFTSLLKKRQSTKKIELGSSFSISASQAAIIIQKQQDKPDDIVPIDIPARVRLWDRWIIKTEYSDKSLAQIVRNRDNRIAFVDAEKIERPLRIRTVRPGDSFIPLGMGGHKKVSDFFVDAKVPFHQRERLPVLDSAKGIVWICGYRIDERFKVTSKTRKTVCIKLKKENEPI